MAVVVVIVVVVVVVVVVAEGVLLVHLIPAGRSRWRL
jgi:hypothetical protein